MSPLTCSEADLLEAGKHLLVADGLNINWHRARGQGHGDLGAKSNCDSRGDAELVGAAR